MTPNDMQQAIKELQEAVIVMTHMQTQHTAMAKDHAQWLADHSHAIADIRTLQRATDERIEKLVSAIGALLRQRDDDFE